MCKPLKWIVGLVIVLALSSLGAAAWAYTTDVYVIWQPTSGGSWSKVTSGTVGGTFKVRVAMWSDPTHCPVAAFGTIEENAAHDTTADTLSFSSATPNPDWDDPDVNHGVVYEATASQEYRHYFAHDIAVTGRYINNGTPVDDPKGMSVTVLNVKVVNTTTTGTIIPWDPDTMSSMSMACDLSHAQNCTAGTWYSIYDTMANGYATPAQVVSNSSITLNHTASDSGSWTPSTPKPTRGVYTFDIGATVMAPDSNNIRGNLQILRATNAQYQYITDAVFDSYNPSMRTNIYKIYYTFKDTSLTSTTDAVGGEIWMYGPKHQSTELELKRSWNISDLDCAEHSGNKDGLSTSSAGIKHGVKVPVPVDSLDECATYFFVIHAHESTTNNWYHVNRPALEMSVKLTKDLEIPACEDLACGGAGCSTCKTCTDGCAQAPPPNIMRPTVDVSIKGILPGLPTQGADLGGCGCSESCVKVYACDTTQVAVFWDPCCGECYKVDFTGETVFPCKKPLGDLSYLEKQTSSATSSYKFYDARNCVNVYSTPDPNNKCSLLTTTDVDGHLWVYGRNGTTNALESVTLPNNNTWAVGHATGDTKVDRFTAPDETTYDIQYSSCRRRC